MTIQEFDLPARWRTLLLENYSEAIHNLEVTWPDVQSLSVSYRDIESFEISSDRFKRVPGHVTAMGIKEMCLAVFQWKPLEVC